MSLRVYIIAGEPSGDRLGGALMRALSRLASVEFAGVGGSEMVAAGLRPLFPISDLSVMGVAEVLPRLPRLLRRMGQTARDVASTRPDVLVTIDSPDFTLRVARRVRRALPDLPVVHYVAPSVWAWRPGRARRMAGHVDHVLALLPFEPPLMTEAGMSCDFVGHPAAAQPRPSVEAVANWRAAHGIDRALLLAPGSRPGVVRRMLPVQIETITRLRSTYPRLAVICPVAEPVAADVTEALASLAGPVHSILPGTPEAERQVAMAAADAALCTSGTITLETAALGVPTVVGYRINPLTAVIARRLVRVDSVTLVNLVTHGKAVPEFLQENCRPQTLEAALRPLIADPAAGDAQRAAFDETMAVLGRDGTHPAERAARSMMAFLERRARE